MNGGTPVFFAYPGRSNLLAETMRTAAAKLAERTQLSAHTWEDLCVDGRLIVGEVLAAIDSSGVVVAEVTHLNSNVLFEIGYAIGSGKHLVLALDTSEAAAKERWQDLGVLTSVGYTGYDGSSEALVQAFTDQRPDLRPETLWEDLLVQGNAGPRLSRSLFYVPLGNRADAGKAVDRSLRTRKDLSLREADEEEQGLAPLPWYAAQIYQSSAALVHLRGTQRNRSEVHNARGSLFAGIAASLKLPTLILAEESFDPPLDYRDLLYNYSTAKQAKARVESWLDGLPGKRESRAGGRKQLAVELPLRQFGEYVAENEKDRLPEYFIETGEFQSVLEAQSTVFVGRKGTGKTANMITAADTLAVDKRNLVVVIKPSGYELESLFAVFREIPTREVADYLIDGMWRFMLMTEVAGAAVTDAERRPAGISTGSAVDQLRDFLGRYPGGHEADFAIRLERLVDELSGDIHTVPRSVDASQAWLNERLHASSIPELRSKIGAALSGRQRVAVLIDNLDKAWERDADREQQSRVILGLLTAIGKLEREFRRENSFKESVNVSLAVFLRADIFDEVRNHAREPDKIRTLEISWADPELLARIIEDRYVIQRSGSAPDDLWNEFFAPTVLGTPTREYLLWRSLPRPRDLVYLCNACVLNAINRQHSRIEEGDVRSAETDYSRFAFDALRVEGSTTEELDEVLLSFAGISSVVEHPDLFNLVTEALQDQSSDEIVGRLIKANFLGVEVSPGSFEYPGSDQEQRVAMKRAQRLSKSEDRPVRYEVHPAFRPYLGVIDESP